MEIQIGGYLFPTKKAAKEKARNILNNSDPGQTIGEDGASFLLALVRLHPNAEEKIGVGVSHFSIETEKTFGRTRHFVLHRVDGTSTDFSFIACIDGATKKKKVLAALRRAVADDIVTFRNEFFSSGGVKACPVSGETITPNTSHVDHEPPRTFLSLVESWMSFEGLDFSDITLSKSVDGDVGRHLSCMDQQTSWIEWHRQLCRLRVVSARANLSIIKRAA